MWGNVLNWRRDRATLLSSQAWTVKADNSGVDVQTAGRKKQEGVERP